MPNVMQRGETWLGTRLHTAGGHSASYSRGNGTPVSLTGTPSKNTFSIADSEGMVTQVESWDWILKASDLGFDPIPGDEIEETVGGVKVTYEVMEFGTQPCFNGLGIDGAYIVVSTKKVDQ